MIWTIATKELLVSLKTVRFVIAILVCVLLMPLSTWVLSTDYLREVADYNERIALEERKIDGANMMVSVNRPIPPLSPLFRGVNAESANSVNLRFYIGWNWPIAASSQSITHHLFPTVDITFIIGFIVSALALMFSFDAFSGEKAAATLRVMMANSVPRWKVVMGKWLGLTLALLAPLIVGMLISLLIFFFITGASFSALEWGALALTSAVILLYVMLFIRLGMTISAFTESPTVSIFISLGVWGLLTVLMPQAGNAIAEMVTPIDDPQTIEKNIRQSYNRFAQQIRDRNKEIVEEARRENWDYERMNLLRNQNEFFTAIDHKSEINEVERNYWNQIARQEQVGRTASMFSPYGAFNQAVISLAGTGPESQRDFLEKAYRYGERYFRQVWTTALDPDDEQPMSDIVTAAPDFSYEPVSFSERLGTALVPILVLILMSEVLFVVAVFAFNRYDVR